MSYKPSFLWAERYAGAATRVTATPAALGEYRSMYKTTASSITRADTAPSAGWEPTVADGARIVRPNWGSTGTSGQPNWWQVFVGMDTAVKVLYYESTGRVGSVYTGVVTSGGTAAAMYGIYEYVSVDENGCIILDAIDVADSAGGNGFIGKTNGANPTNYYFDILVSAR